MKTVLGKALAPTAIVTVIFFVTYRFFGAENTMIAPFATLSFLTYRSMCNHYEAMIKNFAIYIAMAVLASFAVMGPVLCTAVNALALFWIACLLIDEYNPTNYFPAGMALIFFQISPARTPHALAVRIGALLATMAITFVFVLILSKTQKKRTLRSLLMEGFDNCQKQIDACEKGDEETLRSLHWELRNISMQCSGEIYAYNRSSIFIKGKTNWYCRFILAFQIINYLLINHAQDDNLEKARNYYQNFRRLLTDCEPEADYRRLRFRNHRPDIHNFRLRFALRQVIVVTPCLLIAYLSDAPNIYWLAVSVFFMMIPYTDNTLRRVRQRVFGTIGGIMICLVLFTIFHNFPARVIIMTLANFMIYGTSSYGLTVMYITCSALAIQTIDAVITAVLAQRLIYTLIGGATALAANRLVFPIRARNQCFYLMQLLNQIREELRDIHENTCMSDGERKRQTDQRIIKSYLLSKRLETLQETLPEKDSIDYLEYEKRHMTFLARYLEQHMGKNSG